MGIKKIKELPNGTSGEYWRIVLESYDRCTRKMEAHIALYKDKNAAQQGKSHLGIIKVYKFQLTAEEALSNRTQVSYSKIKEMASVVTMGIKHDVPGVVYDSDISCGVDE